MAPETLPSLDLEAFRAVRGAWATGVVVVTAGHGDGRVAGLVMVSLAPVTENPPLVLWSVDRRSSSLDVWLGAPGYALHVLAAGQEELARRFAQKGDVKFDGVATRPGIVGAPLLEDAAATVQAVTIARHDAGGAVILVGRVVAAEVTELPPLLHHRGRLRALPDP